MSRLPDRVMSDRPAFRWSRLEGATGYVVEVYDEQFKLVASSPELTTLSWTATQSLSRGQFIRGRSKRLRMVRR